MMIYPAAELLKEDIEQATEALSALFEIIWKKEKYQVTGQKDSSQNCQKERPTKLQQLARRNNIQRIYQDHSYAI